VPTYGSAGVTVTVNGATVWRNGTFTPTTGVAGGSTDGRYVYLTGVAAGSYTVAGSGVVAPQRFDTSVLPGQLPPGYTRCAAEGGTCTPAGNQVLAYGAGGYDYRVASGATACSAAAFNGDDPAPGVLKSCYLAPAGGPAGYTACAAENGTCTVDGTREVAYGANGAFRFEVVTGSVACDNTAFGTDPLFGAAKSCYVTSASGPPGNWTSCATELSSCSVTGTQPLAFGANGAYWVGSATGTTSCASGAVGVDPIYQVVKACYLWTGPPAGYGTTCAAENGSCSFTGTQTVAYGAAGDFVYRTFTGGTACTTAAFGGTDPVYGVAKSCYLTP
jgi:hypothetical protein